MSVSLSIFVCIAASSVFVHSSDSRTGSASEASLCCASASLSRSLIESPSSSRRSHDGRSLATGVVSVMYSRRDR